MVISMVGDMALPQKPNEDLQVEPEVSGSVPYLYYLTVVLGRRQKCYHFDIWTISGHTDDCLFAAAEPRNFIQVGVALGLTLNTIDSCRIMHIISPQLYSGLSFKGMCWCILNL